MPATPRKYIISPDELCHLCPYSAPAYDPVQGWEAIWSTFFHRLVKTSAPCPECGRMGLKRIPFLAWSTFECSGMARELLRAGAATKIHPYGRPATVVGWPGPILQYRKLLAERGGLPMAP
jgi:hypothetical protein